MSLYYNMKMYCGDTSVHGKYKFNRWCYMSEKEFVDFGDNDFVLVDGKIFVKFARIFELIENSNSLEGLEAICGADLDYIVATYLEKS